MKERRASQRKSISTRKEAIEMLTVFVFLAIAAIIVTIASAMGKAPLWVAVILLCLIELLRVLPLGK